MLVFSIAGCGSKNTAKDAADQESSGNTKSVSADAIRLTWNAPMFNVDGSALDDLAGYKLYYGTSPGNYEAYIDTGNVMSAEINDITRGIIYCFAVTAYDTSGNESDYSEELCAEISVL